MDTALAEAHAAEMRRRLLEQRVTELEIEVDEGRMQLQESELHRQQSEHVPQAMPLSMELPPEMEGMSVEEMRQIFTRILEKVRSSSS